MPQPRLDPSLYIPVMCIQEDSPKYKGKYFMEAICKVVKLNGESIPADRCLVKADFSSGDEVVIRFKNREYRGVVDLARDEESVAKRDHEREDSHSDRTSSGKGPHLTPSPSADGRSRKRKRVERNDGLAAKRSKSVDDPRPRSPSHKSMTRKSTRTQPRPKKSVMPGMSMLCILFY